MNACVIQPPYSNQLNRADELFSFKINALKSLDNSVDLIVLPEYSEVPVSCGKEQTIILHDKYIDSLLLECKNTAVRCDAVLFVNVLREVDGKFRNTTLAIGRDGEIKGEYYKRHIPPGEKAIDVDYAYTEEYDKPYTIVIDGIKYAFLTCYDFYFYEAYAFIARQNVDVIIGCSLQRSDPHDVIEFTCQFLAYNTNAYVVRSSVSFAEDSTVCGASMIVSPKGEVLTNLKGKFGIGYAEFNPKDKFYKPMGFGRPNGSHYEYIEEGRNPHQYRQSGSSVIKNDKDMPYPRVCSHRGFNTIAPENSLPAFGSAVALGAEEIEFDIWATKDGKLVSLHDSSIDRVSNGTGVVFNTNYEDLLKYDFGSVYSQEFKGLKILTFEEILKKFARRVIMNIHVKIWDRYAILKNQKDDEYKTVDLKIDEIISLIEKYDCTDHIYFMTISDEIAERVIKMGYKVCLGHDDTRPYEIVDRAIKIGADKVQLYAPYFNQEMIDKAKLNDIKCNVFYADTIEDTVKYLSMGVDTILTNDYLNISNVVKEYKITQK